MTILESDCLPFKFIPNGVAISHKVLYAFMEDWFSGMRLGICWGKSILGKNPFNQRILEHAEDIPWYSTSIEDF